MTRTKKKKRQPQTKPRRPAYTQENYNAKTRHEDREYGMYWYAWLWKLLRPVLIFLCSMLIVTGLITTGYNYVYGHYFAPADERDASTVTFEVPQGSTVTQIGKALVDAGLLRNASVFKYMIQFQGLTADLSYGTYTLSPSMSVSDVIAELTSGSQTNERVITIVPGWTCEEIANYLVSIGALENTDTFLALCRDADRFVDSSYALSNARETASESFAERKYALEGYLAPDTYRVFTSANAESILTTLVAQENDVIDRVFYGNAQFERDEDGTYHEVEPYDAGLTMDQIIVLASVIEREAATEEDMARVSAVFHNRLKMGWKLESDPTATYLSGVTKYVLSDEEMADPNGYNTYYVTGLPVGPICNPSEQALMAARNPDRSYIQEGYLYFCATEPGQGELIFARTLEEHMANVARYRPLWEQYDQNRAETDSTQEEEA